MSLFDDALHSPGIEIPNVSPEILSEINRLRSLDARVVAALAVACGWRADFAKGIHLVAEDGHKITLPLNIGLNVKVFRSRITTIMRHRRFDTPLRSVVEGIIAHPKAKIDPTRVQILREALDHAPDVAPPVEPAPPNGGTTEPVPVAAHRKVRIVKEEPWSAHRTQKGDTYPSKAVMERTWSNDTVDFACQWPGCDFTDESPHTVAKHNGAHKRGQGKQAQAEVDGFDPAHISNPRKLTRIRALTREIDGAFGAAFAAGLALDPEWLAAWIIDHRVEALPGDTPVSEELSEDQILDKIAALVDRGRGKILREQIDNLQHQVEGYMEERDTLRQDLTEQLDGLKARAEHAEGNLKALRDLINETGEPS